MTNDNSNLFDDTDIDYSEGIGDLLKEKSSYEFSWKKTGTVIAGFIVVLAISVAAVSKLAKALMIPSPDQYQAFEYSTDATAQGLAQGDVDLNTSIHSEGADSHHLGMVDGHEDSQTADSETQDQHNETQVDAQESVAAVEPVNTVQKPVAAKQVQTASDKEDALYRVVIGDYLNRQSAAKVLSQLKQDRISAYVWQNNENGNDIYRVQVGAFSKESSAKTLQAKLTRQGYQPAILYR